jgi:SAM-dependent methyltransferase
VLEIGCGSGVLLREIKGRGANVRGCEIDKISSEVANRALGEQVVANVDATELLKNIDQFYDLIVISHVLEHLRNPVEVLKALRNSMKADGTLLVVVPNLDSAPKAFLRKYWGYWQVPVHLTHFNTDSLIYLIENCGFQIETVATRNADFMSLGLFLSNILRLKKSEPGQVSSQLIRAMSWCWSWTYRFGKQDLIVVARPLKYGF